MKAYINNSQIKYETGKATLITLPRTNNKAFWIPSRLIYPAKQEHLSIVYIPESMQFRVINHKSRSKHVDLWSAERIYEHLEQTTETYSVDNSVVENVPKKMKAKEVEALDELKR